MYHKVTRKRNRLLKTRNFMWWKLALSESKELLFLYRHVLKYSLHILMIL
jgi:hypothetical protein